MGTKRLFGTPWTLGRVNEAPFGHLGPSLGAFWVTFGRSWVTFGPSWPPKAAQVDARGTQRSPKGPQRRPKRDPGATQEHPNVTQGAPQSEPGRPRAPKVEKGSKKVSLITPLWDPFWDQKVIIVGSVFEHEIMHDSMVEILSETDDGIEKGRGCTSS